MLPSAAAPVAVTSDAFLFFSGGRGREGFFLPTSFFLSDDENPMKRSSSSRCILACHLHAAGKERALTGSVAELDKKSRGGRSSIEHEQRLCFDYEKMLIHTVF